MRGHIKGSVGAQYVTGLTFSQEQLQKGLECKIMMDADIQEGMNSDDQYSLYGGIEKYKEPYLEGFFDLFSLKLNEDGQYIKKYTSNPQIPTTKDGKEFVFNEIHDDQYIY